MILSGGKEGKYDTMVQKLEKRYVKKNESRPIRMSRSTIPTLKTKRD